MKSVLTILFLAIALSGFSQDYIVKKDGNRIDCKVTKEDSANVYIIMDLGGKDVNAYINRKEIQYIKFGNNPAEIKNSTQNTATTANTKTPPTNATAPDFKKEKISFNIGFSFPIGSSENLANENTGSAKTGGEISITYKSFYTPNVGLGLKCFGLINPMETKSLNTYFSANTSVSGDWYSGGLLGGLSLESSNENNTTFSLDLLTGIISLVPEMEYNTGGYSTSSNSTPALSLGWNLGIGLSHSISKHCSLAINVDYLYSSFKFKNSSSNQTENVTMNIINLTGGLIFNIDAN